jgi:ABC-2 type transport system permease protein
MSLRRFWAIARKEWIQLRRDPRSLTLAFALPALLIVLFGYAISLDVRNIELAVLDRSRSPESRRVLEALLASRYFTVRTVVTQDAELVEALDHGRVRIGLIIPPTFSQDLAAGRRAPVQLLLDGSDANTATIAQNYADAILAGVSVELTGTKRIVLPVEVRTRVWYNETLQSRNMVVPGLIAVIMSIIAAMLTALTIAREWERGTMEQLAATPVHRLEVVLGKLVPYVGVGLTDVALAVLAGRFVFDVPVRGNLLLLALLALVFLLASLGWGIFLSAALKSQLLATQAAMVTTYLPALLLSGFVFSIPAMPPVLRLITRIVPARYFVTITKGIFLKGVGPATLWPEALALLGFATLGLGLAVRSFRKELE